MKRTIIVNGLLVQLLHVTKGTTTIITNIVDGRKNKHKFKKVDAIVEATSHDNQCKGADQSEYDGAVAYDERSGISINDAVKWAESLDGNITLYLYSFGSIHKRVTLKSIG